MAYRVSTQYRALGRRGATVCDVWLGCEREVERLICQRPTAQRGKANAIKTKLDPADEGPLAGDARQAQTPKEEETKLSTS